MISLAWAAEAVRTIGNEPIYMTYNFFLTAGVGVALSFMLWSLKRTITKADEYKEKLINKSIDDLRDSIKEWQEGAKERTKSLCDKIDRLAHEKVDSHECDRLHKSLDQTLDDIKRRVFT